MEVGRPGVVTRRTDLHRLDVQDRREADLRQGRITEGPFTPFQLEPGWQRQARNRRPRGRSDRRGRVQGVDPRGREPERVVGPRSKKEPLENIFQRKLDLPWTIGIIRCRKWRCQRIPSIRECGVRSEETVIVSAEQKVRVIENIEKLRQEFDS
jgi:hypothetical protein